MAEQQELDVNVQKLFQKLEKVRDSYAAIGKEVEELDKTTRKHYSNTEDGLEDVNDELDKNLTTVQKLEKEYKQLTTAIDKATDIKEIKKLNNEIRETEDALKGAKKRAVETEKSIKKSASGMGKAFNALGAAIVGAFAVQQVFQFGRVVKETTKEISKVQQQIRSQFKLTKDELQGATIQVLTLQKNLGASSGDIIKVAKILQAEFSEVSTAAEALALIETGFEKGANANEQFLEILREYPAQLKQVGLSATESIALITQTEQAGVFSDKGIDAIKEAGIRLRELTKPTKEALDAIGLSSKEIETQLKSGSKNLFDIIQLVSKQLKTLPPQSEETGKALADIFGGAGEDAGLRFLGTLEDINLELDTLESKLSDIEKEQIRYNKAVAELSVAATESGTITEKFYVKVQDTINDYLELVTLGIKANKNLGLIVRNTFNQILSDLQIVAKGFKAIDFGAKIDLFGFAVPDVEAIAEDIDTAFSLLGKAARNAPRRFFVEYGKAMTDAANETTEEVVKKITEKSSEKVTTALIKPITDATIKIKNEVAPELEEQVFHVLTLWEKLVNGFEDTDLSELQFIADNIIGIFGEIADAQVEQANIAVEAKQKQVDELNEQLQTELQLNEQGFASNVALKQQELAEAKKQQEEAIKQADAAQKAQQRIENAQQISAIITAVAEIIQQWSALSPLGAAAGITQVGVMLASYAAARNKVKQLRKGVTGLDAGEVFGASHEAGGVPLGRNYEMEGKEYLSVTPVAQTKKYFPILEAIRVDDERALLNAVMPLIPNSEVIKDIKIDTLQGHSATDYNKRLNSIEDTLKRGFSRKTVSEANGYRTEITGNKTIRVKQRKK